MSLRTMLPPILPRPIIPIRILDPITDLHSVGVDDHIERGSSTGEHAR
jgi:hypothetical protein